MPTADSERRESVPRVDYRSREHLRQMQALSSRIWSPASRWHVGDLVWGRFGVPRDDAQQPTALWFDGDRPSAWAWLQLPDELNITVDPVAGTALVDDVLEWALGHSGPGLTCTVLESEQHLIRAVVAAGFRENPDAPYFRHHRRQLAGLPRPAVPAGFRLRHVRADEAAERAALHRAGWSEFGSRVTTESYAEVMRTWPYHVAFDWVAETLDGDMVASALGWLDPARGVGLLEPVGCAPAYRRRGLSRATNLAALHAFRDAGATTAVVCPRGDEGYPVPALLYQSIGFVPGLRTVSYVYAGAAG